VAPTASSRATLAASSFTDFGTLLRVLRQLGIAVGYSEAQISRLEQGRRAGDRRSGGRYPARWVPKNVKILAQPSIVASGRYIGVW
jgi:hypothetical protein